MGMINRLGTIVKSKVNKLLDRFEDPKETLDYSYEKLVEELQKVKKGIADITTAKKRVELQRAKLEQESRKLEEQAREALKMNREDLARLALERKTVVDNQMADLVVQIEELKKQQEKLTEAEKNLSLKVESFRTQKETIKAQYSAAEAQVRINESVSGMSEELSDVGLAIQRAEDKTENMKARASAIDELIDSGVLEDFTGKSDSIDKELEKVRKQGKVEDDLQKLKEEVKK
jgi:phage shock protein A